MFEDTIAAVSTAMGVGGIGIVRVSGSNALDIGQRVFVSAKGKNIKSAKTHTIQYGNIVCPNTGNIIEEGLVMIMKGPSTYTREDIIEINCHGGILSVQKVLEAVLKAGARLAEPGEFTKRAFLNGRIDLSQAEAVIDIINSRTELFHNCAINQLEGSLSKKVMVYRDELLTLIAHIEASIDYPEHDLESENYNEIEQKTKDLIEKIDLLIATSDTGKIIREGIKTVIIGRPNVGKSSLLNALLQEQRAIVTDIPGTTRDVLEEYININGIALKIIDTAGIRETDDIIEKIGVEKSREYSKSADLVLMVLDGSKPLTDDDIAILQSLINKKYLILINKIDLPSELEYEKLYNYVNQENIIKLSIKNNTGIDQLEQKLKDMFLAGQISSNDNVYITNVRHKDCLVRARLSLNEVLNTVYMRMPEDCMSIDLQKAYEILGEITGQSVEEDLIDRIFSEFCLGK